MILFFSVSSEEKKNEWILGLQKQEQGLQFSGSKYFLGSNSKVILLINHHQAIVLEDSCWKPKNSLILLKSSISCWSLLRKPRENWGLVFLTYAILLVLDFGNPLPQRKKRSVFLGSCTIPCFESLYCKLGIWGLYFHTRDFCCKFHCSAWKCIRHYRPPSHIAYS